MRTKKTCSFVSTIVLIIHIIIYKWPLLFWIYTAIALSLSTLSGILEHLVQFAVKCSAAKFSIFFTISAIALNFSRPLLDHPLPLSLSVVLSNWRRTLENVYWGTLRKQMYCVNAQLMWQQQKGPHWTYRHIFLIIQRQCSNWLRKRKSLVSVALICTTDYTCKSAYLFDVDSVLRLPTSRIIIKHNQQKCFVTERQHKPLKNAILGATICCSIRPFLSVDTNAIQFLKTKTIKWGAGGSTMPLSYLTWASLAPLCVPFGLAIWVMKARNPTIECRFRRTLKLYGYIRRTDYCGIGVLTHGRTGYCWPLLHLRHHHVSICPDVDVRKVTLHIRDSKLNANPRVTLSNFDDAPKYGRTFQKSEILRAGRAYGKSRIRSTNIFKICKHDSTRYLRDSTSKLINWDTMMYLSSTLSPTFYTLRIQKDTSILYFQVQIYIRCTFIHKVHKEQMENSFLI